MFSKIKLFIIIIIMIFLAGCTQSESNDISSETQTQPAAEIETFGEIAEPGQIYLYSQTQGVEKIMNRHLELWHDYYHNENMRHLFIESPYFQAEFFNIWMKADNDDIFDELFADIAGYTMDNDYTKAFYKKIKSDYPETVFHGTDVGMSYWSTGERFIQYLNDNNLAGSEQYLLAVEAIEQGVTFYNADDDGNTNINHRYRAEKTAENFIREFDKLNGQSVMGIYGAAHAAFGSVYVVDGFADSMAEQLWTNYGRGVHTEDLSWLEKDIEPLRADIINVGGKDYEASYFGEQDLTGLLRGYVSRGFWRLENAYDDFESSQIKNSVLPYDNYPMLIETEQVFVIDMVKTNSSVERWYFRSDLGVIYEGVPATQEFIVN